MTPVRDPTPFRRHGGNPILSPADWPYPVNTVFNAGAVEHEGETLLLVRIEDRAGASHLCAARSRDGLGDWRVDSQPTLSPSPDHPEEIWGVEDPRINRLDEIDRYAVTYTAYSPSGPGVSLATTSDFRSFERLGMVFCPENKDAALLPGRVDGRWWMLPRPVAGGVADIWLSASTDLVHWGEHRVVMRARSGPYWDAGKIGLSAQPIRTDGGWLVLYHGVKQTVSGGIYRQGLALLDLERPWQVLARTPEWIFAPNEPFERTGDVGNVVFCCGWTLHGDEVRMYYGGADTCMCVATASLGELLDLLR